MIPVSFAGTLAFPPEIRFTPGGIPVASLVVVTKERKFDKGTGWIDGDPSFWDVETWRAQAEEVYEKLRKGDTVFVSGKLYKEKYEVDGQPRYKVKVTAEHVGLSMKWGKPREEEPQPEKAAVSFGSDNTEPPF